MTKRNITAKVRKFVNERDGGLCQHPRCELSRKSGDRMNLHHVRPEQFGGTEDPKNLITLCDIHHKAMHVEFSAFYPDSQGVLFKMNQILRRFHSRARGAFGIDDGYDLKMYLELLTGRKTFREGQIEVVRAAIQKRDVLFVTPTGSGKSVCYQLPGILDESPTLVLSPLKALMKDQVKSIWNNKIPATYINSDLSIDEKKKRFDFISKHLYKFIFVAPERFFRSNDPQNKHLYQNYSHLVVDEAHEIDLWGKSFRSSYNRIGELRTSLGNPSVIALTASASQKTQSYIIENLNLNDPKIIVTGFYRNNINILKHTAELDIMNNTMIGKLEYITDVIQEAKNEKILIFVPTIKKGDELMASLVKEGIDADFFHSKIDTKKKMQIQDRFTGVAEPRLPVLISTSAFGMGIDIPDIRHLIHWSPALSVEDYYQQIGRAGRDGKPSTAHLLFHEMDRRTLEFLSTVSMTTASFKKDHGYSDEEVDIVKAENIARLDQMMGLLTVENGQEWNYILEYFGQTPPTFWSKYGMKIVNIIISIADSVIVLCVLSLVYIFIFNLLL
jgi:ATP-dependent DNA helicase RecQ